MYTWTCTMYIVFLKLRIFDGMDEIITTAWALKTIFPMTSQLNEISFQIVHCIPCLCYSLNCPTSMR